MLTEGRLVGFLASTDLARSERFYGGTLGLNVLESDPYAVVLDVRGTQVRVTLVEAKAEARYTVLGWDVDDLDATVADLVGRGIAFARYDGMGQDSSGVWTAPDGSRIAWFHDPDGNTLSLHQAPS
jgi:catechol 2,3-dioxygenase-like lactoylglutathione lyase family enzyme